MRVLVADKHLLVLDALQHYFENYTSVEMTPSCDMLGTLHTMVNCGPFDLVVLDIDLCGTKGLEVAFAIRGRPAIAIMSGSVSKETVEKALMLGAVGFVPKTLPLEMLEELLGKLACSSQYSGSYWGEFSGQIRVN